MTSQSAPSHHVSPSGDKSTDRNANITFSSTTAARARRLQLRNAGFRGAAVPTRKVTPNSTSASTWSSITSGRCSPDRENRSPSGIKNTMMTTGSRRHSNGVLQEISNSSVRRPRQTLIAMDTTPMTNEYDAAVHDYLSSPPMASVTPSVRIKATKTRRKVMPRRSVNGEARKYVEHLEAELVATQSQLAKVDSPTAARQQTAKMRTLSAETRQLQAEVAEWESKYEERVRDEIERHGLIEDEMHARIRTLEESNEEATLRNEELELELRSARSICDAVEVANIQLEKRLEIMSDLLASKPHLDLYAQTPGRRQFPARPHSMVPRIPVAGILPISPNRNSWTMPTSPVGSPTQLRRSPTVSPARPSSAGFAPFHHSDEPIRLDPSLAAARGPEAVSIVGAGLDVEDSTPFEQHVEHFPVNNPNGSRLKSARRMRRFGAGSFGPKPLILSSASQCDVLPTSAPLYGRNGDSMAPSSALEMGLQELGSPVLPSRKSCSLEDTQAGAASPSLLMLDTPRASGSIDDCILLWKADESQGEIMREYSSASPTLGRNLMEELSRVQPNEGDSALTLSAEDRTEACEKLEVLPNSPSMGSSVRELQECTMPSAGAPSTVHRLEKHEIEQESDNELAYVSDGPFMCSTWSVAKGNRCISPTSSLSMLDRLRLLFSTCWRRRLELAQHMVQNSQIRMWIPEPLRNVQWWLVGILWGPMAKRKLLSESNDTVSHRGRSTTPPTAEQPVYGPLHSTPPVAPHRMAGHGKKRTPSGKHTCTHQTAMHSPWLWLRFSITLAFAIGTAFTAGPGILLKADGCDCRQQRRSSLKEVPSSDITPTSRSGPQSSCSL